MIELSNPGLLFNKQKIFHLRDSVTTTITKHNTTKALVVYNSPGETLAEPVKQMLDKLILACQFNAEQTQYVNVHFTGNISLGKMQSLYNPAVVLIFGDVDISHNLSSLKKNYPYDFSGVKVLNADSLELLVKNDAAKKSLWGVLKKMLGL